MPFDPTELLTSLVARSPRPVERPGRSSDASAKQSVTIELPEGGASCSAPLVLNGSIIRGTSPEFVGRLIRDGVPGI